jgi:ricin-type beta-trefoil lectin protein
MTKRLLFTTFAVLAPLPALAQGFVPAPLTAEVRMLDGTREMCLDVPDSNPADQLHLQMFPCHNVPNERWLLRFDFSGFVILESESTHRCLDVPNTSTVQQFRCHGGDNQRWQLFEDPETLRFRLRPKIARDRCLHVAENNNNRMDLVACDTTPGAVRFSRARWERQNFEFRLQRPLEAFDAVINEDRQFCLDVQGLSQNNGAVVQTFPCNGGRNQRWRLVREADGFFRLQADHSQKCLRRTGTNGGVDQAACDGTDRQKWFPQLTSTGRVKLQTKEPLCHLVPGPSDSNPRGFCECLNAEPNSQALRVLRCTSAADLWRLGPGRHAPGALTFFEDNGVRGDRLCGLPPGTAGEFRFEEPGARACENDEARSLLLYEVAAGTEIEVFDDGQCRTNDDHTLIRVKRSVARYELGSFERGFEDEFLKVERLTSGNLDGKVSCARIRTPR